MEAPLVSVIIPCFNSEKWIGATIQSALRQTHENVEVIVVNDGSTDNSREAIAAFGPAVKLVDTDHRGVCAARNTGLAHALGQWIHFLDSDDLLHGQCIEILLLAARRWEEAAFAWAPLVSVAEDFTFDRSNKCDAARISGAAVLDSEVLKASYAPAVSLFERSFLDRIGPWNESLRRWTDLEYHARIAAALPKFAALVEPLYFYRQHAGPRISAANASYRNLHDGMESLRLAHEALSRGWPHARAVSSYFAPFYLNLARSAAANGDRKNFVDLLDTAAQLRNELSFSLKCRVAKLFASAIGLEATSKAIETALRIKTRK